jgi:hypothetical protein
VGLLEDDVGIAFHQAVDGSEIPDFIGSRGRSRRELDLSEGDIRGGCHQPDQAE